MENKKNNTGFAVINIILVSLVILLTGYIVYDKVLSNKKDENNSVETKKENKTDSNVDVDKIGKQLFEKYGNYVYSNENLDYNNLGNSVKLEMALLNSDTIIYNKDFDINSKNLSSDGGIILDYYMKISIADLEKSYKELFGQDRVIDYTYTSLSSINHDSGSDIFNDFSTIIWIDEVSNPLGCRKEDNEYVCYIFWGGDGVDIGNIFDYDYSELKNDKLYVYVNYLGINSPGEGKLCSDYAGNNVIDDTMYTEDNLINSKNELFEKYKDKTGVYKLVFNKDSNDNWYWEETQIVKK